MTLAIDPTSDELNYVVVMGIRSPGRATLTGVKIPYKWDIIQLYGREGAVTRFRGRGVMKFTLTITMWRREHFLAWPLFAKVLEPPTKLRPFVVEMRHPLLSASDVKGVSVEEFGQPERQDNGFWISTSSLLEYRPDKPVLIKPRGGFSAVDKGKPIEPKTEAQRAAVEAVADLKAARARANR